MKHRPPIKNWLSRVYFTPPRPFFMNRRVPDRDANYDDYVGQNQVLGMDSDDWTDETKTLISPPPILGTLSDLYIDKDIVQRYKARETDNEDWADETSTLIPPTVDYEALSDFCGNDKIARNKKASEMDDGDWADETRTLTSPTADYEAPSDFYVGDEIDQNKKALEMNSGDWASETSTLPSPTTQTFEAPHDFYVDYDSMRDMKEVLRTRRNDSDWPDETSTVSSVTPSELFGPPSSENLNDDGSGLDSPGPKLLRFFSDFYRDYWACLGELRESGQQVIIYEDENN
ncbi:hypothetical protein BC827DRAFT_1163139 [Russula dissimulans]|nr:hypothetical protein BC827DRAFT_1163139 [Russula dissimulans]